MWGAFLKTFLSKKWHKSGIKDSTDRPINIFRSFLEARFKKSNQWLSSNQKVTWKHLKNASQTVSQASVMSMHQAVQYNKVWWEVFLSVLTQLPQGERYCQIVFALLPDRFSVLVKSFFRNCQIRPGKTLSCMYVWKGRHCDSVYWGDGVTRPRGEGSRQGLIFSQIFNIIC